MLQEVLPQTLDTLSQPLTPFQVEPQYPSQDEVAAYTSLFDPSLNLAKALNSFKANSKANTLRSGISSHLCPRFYNITTGLLPPKRSRTHTNPYLSLWMYACHELEWAGPLPSTTHTKISHHILPVSPACEVIVVRISWVDCFRSSFITTSDVLCHHTPHYTRL